MIGNYQVMWQIIDVAGAQKQKKRDKGDGRKNQGKAERTEDKGRCLLGDFRVFSVVL